MLERTIPTVVFSCEDVGEAFATASDKQQRCVLIAMANAVDEMGRNGGSWPLQCRAIVDGYATNGLSVCDRSRIASMLGCLIDHLTE